MRRRILLVSASLLLFACRGDQKAAQKGFAPPPQAKSEGPRGVAGPSGDAVASEAHAEAFKAWVPKFNGVFATRDPLGHAIATNAPLSLPSPLRHLDPAEDIAALQAGGDEIRPRSLPEAEGRTYFSFDVGLRRQTWAGTNAGGSADDPSAYLRDLVELEREIRRRLLSGGSCPECVAIFEALPAALETSSGLLRRASPAGLRGAGVLALELTRALENLRSSLEPAAGPALLRSQTALGVYAQRAGLRADQVDASSEARGSWKDEISPTGTFVGMPDRWGPKHSRKVLEIEEAWRPPDTLRADAEANLNRYANMVLREQVKGPPQGATSVSAQRCEGLWTPMLGLAEKQPAMTAKLDCEALSRYLQGRKLTDADLSRLLIEQGLVAPTQLASLQKMGEPLALVRGRWNQDVAPLLRTVMFASALGQRQTIVAVVQDIQARSCLAVTAASIHGSWGLSDWELNAWLAIKCSSQAPKQWREEALRDPRYALSGLALATLGPLPQDMVPVVEFAWAPAGVAMLLSAPPGELRPGNLDQQIEAIRPD